MKVLQTSLNIVYPKIDSFRKKFVNSEEKLKKSFLQTTLLPVPDEAAPEIPRVIANTPGSHSMLNMGLTVAAFNTNYDNDFVSNWDKCVAYVKRHTDVINSFISELTDTREYVGHITNIDIEDATDGVDRLKKILFDNARYGDAAELSCKFTYIVDETYYVNITVANKEKYNAEVINNRVYLNETTAKLLSVLIDVNDRYAASRNRDYVSDQAAIDRIFELTTDFINNKLSTFIESGELSYEG